MSYKIIGGDQKEYGPVPLEQLRRWVAEGRLDAHSLVQPEGETGWRPLSSFPELMLGATAAAARPAGGPTAPFPETAPAPFSARPRSPTGAPTPAPEEAVRAPAILLIITAGLSIVRSLLGLVQSVSGTNMLNMGQFPPNLPPQFVEWVNFMAGPIPNLGMLALTAVVMFGAISMLKLQRWGLALAACIIAIACECPFCCPLGIVGGIWGLVVLTKPEIKLAFH